MKAKLLFFLLLIAPFAASCNKEEIPIILSGNWYIDNDYVYTNIKYDITVGNNNPNAVQYLVNHEDDFSEPLKNIKRLTFSGLNTVTFQYLDNTTATGTYTQEGSYFFIESAAYPDGLAGASDGTALELYYPLEYMTDILESLLTPSDPSPALFEELIVSFVGIATYTPSVN